MQYRQIGTSSLRASVAGLGCNNLGARLDADGARRVIDRALDRGITLFDTSDSYGKDGASEKILGQILGARRKDVLIASKFGWPLDDSGQRQGASRRYVVAAVEASLKRLNTDWIDLYQLHRPDPETPIEETLGALEDLVRQGKIRAAGCSDLSPAQMTQAATEAKGRSLGGFVSSQNHYNLLARKIEADVIPGLRGLGMSLLPYAPLAAGLLSGKFRQGVPLPEGTRLSKVPRLADRYFSDENWQMVERLIAFAAARNRPLVDVAFGWLLSRPPVCSVIAGAMTPEQVDANVAAAEFTLTAEEIAEVDAITLDAT